MKSVNRANSMAGTLALIFMSCASSAGAQVEPRFGTRAPRTCPHVTSKPVDSQISMLIQCGYERTSHDYIYLMQDVRVETGGTRPFNSFGDGYATDIDASAKVLPIRGSMAAFTCGAISDMAPSNRGSNCFVEISSSAKGICWRTTFGTWSCSMIQVIGSEKKYNQPPPR